MVSEAPTGVKVISVLFYIEAVLSVILAIVAFVAGNVLANMGIPFVTALGVGLGIILLIWAVLTFFIGRGLWKGQSWARILAIVFAVLGLIGSISSLASGVILSGIVGLLVSGAIGWYLIFCKQVKTFFK